jgi:AcrR family transcriptional regulator
MRKPSGTDRQTRILDAAENAIAESGFAGASLRDIVKEAGVNLATVYYYFRSKEGLMEAVLKRRFGPLREEHLALLRQFEAKANGRPVPVEQILEAMLLPPLRLAARAPAKHQAVTRLIGRIVAEPNPQMQAALTSMRVEVRAEFLKALRRTFPKAQLPDLRWRVELVWGALAFVLCNARKIEIETRGACHLQQTDQVLAEMIRFFSPGFHAVGCGAGK